MADAKTPSSTKRKTTSRSSNGSSQKSGSGSAKSRSGSTRARSSASRSTRAASSRAQASGNASGPASGNASATASGNGSPKTVVITGVATAAAGVVGGVILAKRMGQRPRHVLGVRVPGSGMGLNDVSKQVKRSGKQFGKVAQQIAELTDEVRTARQKAEEVGKAIL
jgi:hypothetical protein